MASEKQRQKIVETFMGLVAEHGFSGVALADVAAGAGVTPAQLRGAYDGRMAILADAMARTDRAVLDGIDPDLSGEPARERLLDVLMRRIDHVTPHKAAIARLLRDARRDPAFALALNGLLVTSMRWMMVAAGTDRAGAAGLLRAQGLAAVWMKTLEAWLGDEDPGLAATLVALDGNLRRGERWLGCADRLAGTAARLACRLKRGRVRTPAPAAGENVAGEGI